MRPAHYFLIFALLAVSAAWGDNEIVGEVELTVDGEIRLTHIDANTDGPSEFSGTFHRVMGRDSGESKTIEDGRFEIRGAQFFEGN